MPNSEINRYFTIELNGEDDRIYVVICQACGTRTRLNADTFSEALQERLEFAKLHQPDCPWRSGNASS